MNFLRKNFRDHLYLIAFSFFIVAGFQYLIITLVVEADILNLAQSFFKNLPAQFQQLFGEEYLAQFSINGAVALGYNHPLVLVMLAIIAIHFPGKHIAGENENGTLELIFSLPVRRISIAFSVIFFSFIVLLIVIGGCLGGSLLALTAYPEAGRVPLGKLFKIAANLWLLMLFINSYTFLLSAYSRESSKATLSAGILTIIFYFVHYIVRMWTAVDFLKPFTIFNYYQPQKLMLGAVNFWGNVALLITGILILNLLAVRHIHYKDIP